MRVTQWCTHALLALLFVAWTLLASGSAAPVFAQNIPTQTQLAQLPLSRPMMVASCQPTAPEGSRIVEKYNALGGSQGFLRNPTAPIASTPDGLGCFQSFEGGAIYWSAATGAHEVHGRILDKWASLGWEKSILGYPLSDETVAPDSRGRFNQFQGGIVYWSEPTGAHEVHGEIRAKWESLGSEKSILGYPISDEIVTPDGVGHINYFQRGTIVWTRTTGPNVIPDLAEAERSGKVRLTVVGNNGYDSLSLTIESLSDVALQVVIRVGTVFQPLSNAVQSLVVRETQIITLTSRQVVRVQVAVACANMVLKSPSTIDRFLIGIPAEPDLFSLLSLPDLALESFQIQQYAIWIITNNPFASEIWGVTASDLQRIANLFRKAGIPTDRYAVFTSFFGLVNRHTQKCLTAKGPGNPVVQETCMRGRADQLWYLPAGALSYGLQSKSGVCVAYDPSNQHNTLFGMPCTGPRPWTLLAGGTYDAPFAPPMDGPQPIVPPITRSMYYLIRYTDQCVDVDAWNHNEGGTIIHDACRYGNNDNQLWARW